MSRTIKVAAVQMDANPAPTGERLARATQLVTAAAESGAQLIVLPELFNTGYAYTDANHNRAEPLDGPTATWMRETAARLNVHLAGSLMLLDQDEVFNAQLLFAPNGRFWRYDKLYPWGWERGYFREGHHITVADTDLGDLGMMICWDSSHPNLWKRYAGRVDMMVITSCPPDVGNPTFHFANGQTLTYDEMGPAFASLKGSAQTAFGEMINQQTAWLNVPTVHTTGAGRIRTALPNSAGTFLSFLPLAPQLASYLPQANRLQLSAAIIEECKVVDASGEVLTQLSGEQGDAFTMAEVMLPDEKPQPQTRQPISLLQPLAYFTSDIVLPLLTIPVYRRGLRRAWGQSMAPVAPSTRRWAVLLGLGTVAGFIAGALWNRKK